MFVDNHCHLLMEHSGLDNQDLARSLPPGIFCLMSTSYFDLEAVHQILMANDSVVPYYGAHPWYSHLFRVKNVSKEQHYNSILRPPPPPELLDALPEPYDFHEYLGTIRKYAEVCKAQLKNFGIGELGLDKLFRVPTNGIYGNQAQKDNVSLSSCKVTMEHQLAIYTEQLKLANELRAPVSLHCVKAHGAFFDSLAKSSDFNGVPAVILHSYTGSIEQAQAWIKEYRKKPTKLFFSFSNYINATDLKLPSLHGLLDILEDEQVLLETDMPLDRFFLLDKKDEYAEHANSITNAVKSHKNWQDADAILLKNSTRIYHV